MCEAHAVAFALVVAAAFAVVVAADLAVAVPWRSASRPAKGARPLAGTHFSLPLRG